MYGGGGGEGRAKHTRVPKGRGIFYVMVIMNLDYYSC